MCPKECQKDVLKQMRCSPEGRTPFDSLRLGVSTPGLLDASSECQVRLFGTGGGKVKQGALGDCWLLGFPGSDACTLEPKGISKVLTGTLSCFFQGSGKHA